MVKGTNLAVRDMLSSDPYKAQTTVMRSNLNPIWNEELMLLVPQNYGPLKLEVYDYDTFSTDDIMGEADIDIQWMISSAMVYGDAAMFGNMQIGKWIKADDNALVEDTIVNIVDGRVKEEVSLKLQNVESGEIDLELEWISLEQ
ncbi:probable ADP-ribosylation factor GTPase-activating protein AGD13 [Impatiens glandulifera]|uniref:probable ADP-ribosylation factor GTPase-activating protein AGD13 n=1 Tax=Impatiens glandulifera TaxID=253017 RepID=UPI001FB19467|nr:probable ADP-ribosylation factor GTPase-activating protein AGD13 [Impatiens glandulifera]